MRFVAGDFGEGTVYRKNALGYIGDDDALVAVFEDSRLQAQLRFRLEALGDIHQIAEDCGGIALRIARQGKAQAGPEYLAGFFAAFDHHLPPAMFEEGFRSEEHTSELQSQ